MSTGEASICSIIDESDRHLYEEFKREIFSLCDAGPKDMFYTDHFSRSDVSTSSNQPTLGGSVTGSSDLNDYHHMSFKRYCEWLELSE